MTASNALEPYRKYAERVQMLQEARKARPLKTLRNLGDYLAHYAHFTRASEMRGVSQAHIAGLASALGNLSQSESALGLFSDAFEEASERLAIGCVLLTMKDPPLAAFKLVQWWLKLDFIAATGLMELARQKAVPGKKGVYFDQAFRDELLQVLLVHSDYPRTWFQQMGYALGIEEKKIPLFTDIFEWIAITTSLLACAKEMQEIRQEWIENLASRLLGNLNRIIEAIDSDSLSEEVPRERALLEQMRIALERSDIDGFMKTWVGLLEESHYPKEHFQNDLSAIKGLFTRFKEAYFASKENPATMAHLVG
jgi:hypothetical protein